MSVTETGDGRLFPKVTDEALEDLRQILFYRPYT